MRVAFVSIHGRGGVVVVRDAIAEGLRAAGVGVGVYEANKVSSGTLNDYDLVHFLNADAELYFDLDCPTVATVHHISHGFEQLYEEQIKQASPSMLLTFDPFAERQLHRMGFHNVACIAQPIDKSRFSYRPLPRNFTIGWLGGDEQFKRVEMIERVAERMDIPCIGHNSEPWWSEDELQDFYTNTSCYVVASWEDGGPIPAQEALLCGRPVITTPVGQMPRVVREGENGMFYDGSEYELEMCLRRMRDSVHDLSRTSVLDHYDNLIADGHDVVCEMLEIYRRAGI